MRAFGSPTNALANSSLSVARGFKLSPQTQRGSVAEAAQHLGRQVPLPSRGVYQFLNPSRLNFVLRGTVASRELLRSNWDDLKSFLGTKVYDLVPYGNDLLPVAARWRHVLNQLQVSTAVQQLREQFTGSDEEFCGFLREHLSGLLKSLVESGSLNLEVYQIKNSGVHGYAKYLLFSHSSAKNPFCLQLFAFAPGQETPIHDHPCECTSVVVQNELIEHHYQVKKADEGRPHVEKLLSVTRGLWSEGAIDLEENNPHSLEYPRANELDERFAAFGWANAEFQPVVPLFVQPRPTLAISVHLYEGIDGVAQERLDVTNRRGEKIPAGRVGQAAVTHMYAPK